MAADDAQGRQQCQVCNGADARYTCPCCQKRTCSLQCVKAHKAASGCSGKRDRTAFVGRAQFDERTFFSDYRFLEEVQLAGDVAKRSKPPPPKQELPGYLAVLVQQASRRGVQLHILPPGMERRRGNTTRYDARTQTLHWRLHWRFPAADGVTATDARVHENSVLADLLRRHLELQPGEAARHHALREHAAAGLQALTVVMRKERTPANAVEYFEIDTSRPLRQQLAGKVIVEHPVFVVLLPRERPDYKLVAAAAAAAPAMTGGDAAPGAAAASAGGAASEAVDPPGAALHAAERAAVAAVGAEAANALQGGARLDAAPPPTLAAAAPAGAS